MVLFGHRLDSVVPELGSSPVDSVALQSEGAIAEVLSKSSHFIHA